ncbi:MULTISPECIES: FAD:protein FMN transferase [Clostridium]|uniref:FAD:protein FMN transferase n=1 Tax=Clostridium TaxID=1485 RepID=UPI000826E0C5|nr:MULTISPECIES: FAD:protein FMN transferase [Clostridium]PJI09310.1 FAD:protein FMN transferase [Clostridium sp. CT7]
MSMKYFDSEMFCMGTNITQRVYGENGEEVSLEVQREMRKLEKLMNFYKASSEISILNKYGFEKEIKLSKEVFDVIRSAKYFSEKTHGAFDVTLAPVIKMWGVFTESPRVPSNEGILKTLECVGYSNLILDDNKRTVRFIKENMKIDLGGIAKGYAADKAVQIYSRNEVKGAFINLGGNVIVFGKKDKEDEWNIGIQNPLKGRGEILGAVKVKNKSVVTSGSYVRYFEKDNIRYHHIIDPRTGYPADSDLLSVTIISKNSMLCDALSTAVFVLGYEKGINLLTHEFEEVSAIFITKDKKVKVTDNIIEDFVLVEESGFDYN